MTCPLCRDIYTKGGSVESFLSHYNRDHTGHPLSTNCPFSVYQCTLCHMVTKTQRGLTRHTNARHAPSTRTKKTTPSSTAIPSAPRLSDVLPPRPSPTTNSGEPRPVQRATRSSSGRRREQCTPDVLRRIQHALSHRMCVIDMHTVASVPQITCFLQGARNRQYKVDITTTPHCSCNDYANGHICKHMYYMYLKVFRMSEKCPLLWQPTLPPAHIQELIKRIPSQFPYGSSSTMKVIDLCTPPSSPKLAKQPANRVDVVEECPLCFDPFTSNTVSLHCRNCMHAIHQECMDVWAATCVKSQRPITCTLCRSQWK